MKNSNADNQIVEARDSIPKEIEVVLKSGKILKVQVTIPWLPAKCMQCNIFGNGEKNCPKKVVVMGKQVPKKKEVGIEREAINENTEAIDKGKQVMVNSYIQISSKGMEVVIPSNASTSGKKNGRAGSVNRFN